MFLTENTANLANFAHFNFISVWKEIVKSGSHKEII